MRFKWNKKCKLLGYCPVPKDYTLYWLDTINTKWPQILDNKNFTVRGMRHGKFWQSTDNRALARVGLWPIRADHWS